MKEVLPKAWHWACRCGPRRSTHNSVWRTQGHSLPAWHLLVSILDCYCVGPISGRGIVDSVGAVSIVTHLYRLSHSWARDAGSEEYPGTIP